jgi:hypothetical protein
MSSEAAIGHGAEMSFRRKRRLTVRYIGSARRAVAAERSGAADTQLGMVLTSVAGAVNASGFFAIGQYTSHMSGIFSALADNLVLGSFGLALAGLAALLSVVAARPARPS